MSQDTAIVMVRHPAVQLDIKGVCYGATDVPLSAYGLASVPGIAARICTYGPDRVVHSGLTRARLLAEAIADKSGRPLVGDGRLAELNFGAWEQRPWSEIFTEVGHAMALMIHQPDTFAPPGGETVLAMRDRAVAGLLDLPRSGVSVVVCHGGPMSAIQGTLADLEPRQWPDLVPGYGKDVTLNGADIDRLSAIAQAT